MSEQNKELKIKLHHRDSLDYQEGSCLLENILERDAKCKKLICIDYFKKLKF
jgi:hypothetical protein